MSISAAPTLATSSAPAREGAKTAPLNDRAGQAGAEEQSELAALRGAGRKLRLVADVGGTNTRVALATSGQVIQATLRRYSNEDFSSLEMVLARFHEEVGSHELSGGSVAVAGPVRANRGRLTNLDWDFHGDTLGAAVGLPPRAVMVLNDLQAQGHALGHIAPANLRQVVSGNAVEGEARLVIGMGTGFNAAVVHELPGGGRLVAASECGHVTVPSRTRRDLSLSRFIGASHSYPCVEETLSGRGLANIDAWLRSIAGSDLAPELESGGPEPRDSVGVFADVAGDEPRAKAAVQAFLRVLGTVAGDLALVHLPFGGIYLAGGMARAITPFVGPMDMAGALRDKGRFGPLISQIPVTIIEDDFAALTGCANAAERAATGPTGATAPV